jgi:hypothetical protein
VTLFTVVGVTERDVVGVTERTVVGVVERTVVVGVERAVVVVEWLRLSVVVVTGVVDEGTLLVVGVVAGTVVTE